MAWNSRSREENISKAAMGYSISYIVNTILQFIYRTIFIRNLTSEYLGIESLFSNIIQLLAFAELGIGSSIAYRLYEPIKKRDSKSIAEYMYLYKIGYRLIACVVGVIGLSLIPFLDYIMKDATEVPEDVNLVLVYLLFLLQSITSYFFIYKQTLLAADQRGDLQAKYNCIGKVSIYIVKIVILVVTKNYILVLCTSILTEICTNYVISVMITRRYKYIFTEKVHINKNLINGIIGDIRAILCHRVGSTVLNSTDNIIMSKYIGLSVLGVYANYMLIVTSVKNLMYQALGNFNGSIGNAHVSLECEERHVIYKRLHFINLWIANIVTVILYAVITPFVKLWQGNQITLDNNTVIAIVVCFYLNIVRCVDISYTNAVGVFKKDLWRPLVEAVINLVVSICLVKKIGVAGIVWGTIIAQITTVWWRESYLIYKFEFNKKPIDFWLRYFKFAVITFLECIFISKCIIVKSNLGDIFSSVIIIFVCINIVMIIVNYKNEEFCWLFCSGRKMLKNRFEKIFLKR